MTVRLRRIITRASTVAGLTTLIACASEAPTRRTIAIPIAAGAAAPAYSARALNGDSVTFGGDNRRLTLVNVWATWCTSCREEFAELERLRVTHEAAGLQVMAVSVDQGGDEKVRRFAEAQGSRFPVVHDREARITALYGVVGLPSTYLIDADGRVRWMLTGSFLEARVALEREILSELEGRKTSLVK